MQRKFLEDLGLDKETVDKIIDENGSDIEKARSKAETERDNYKSQLETAQDALKEFEGVDVKDLQGKIQQLNDTLSQKETEYQAKIADMEFDAKLSELLKQSGVKNAKAAKALLDLDTLKASKNQDADIKAAVDTCKEENGYLFGSDEPIHNPIAPTGGNTPPDSLSSMRAALGLSAETK